MMNLIYHANIKKVIEYSSLNSLFYCSHLTNWSLSTDGDCWKGNVRYGFGRCSESSHCWLFLPSIICLIDREVLLIWCSWALVIDPASGASYHMGYRLVGKLGNGGGCSLSLPRELRLKGFWVSEIVKDFGLHVSTRLEVGWFMIYDSLVVVLQRWHFEKELASRIWFWVEGWMIHGLWCNLALAGYFSGTRKLTLICSLKF